MQKNDNHSGLSMSADTLSASLRHKLALFAVAAAFVVIGLGAFTRLVDAGLGCPDWPTCYGHILWPHDEVSTEKANAVFNETPVEHDKTWPEQVHRLFASLLGLVSLVIFALGIRASQDKKLNRTLIALVTVLLVSLVTRIVLAAKWDVGADPMHDFFDLTIAGIVLVIFAIMAVLGLKRGQSLSAVKLSAFIVGFVILQGLFGMWTVTLKVWPQVVTLHLLGGFTVVSLFWLLALRLRNNPWRYDAETLQGVKRLQAVAALGLLVVFLQIALGGWTTSNYAAVACPDFPTCQHQMWPDMDFKRGFDISQGIGPNYLGGQMENEARIAIHMSHRIGAIITTVFLVFLFLRLSAIKQAQTTVMGFTLLGVLFLQVGLGLANIIFHFPLSVAVLHNAGGAILLLTMVTLNYRIATAKLTP
ncbi:Heme A synthase [BD1-7 clade bacterium]|uniref:Heme A synthase n=1 Tax=BD1-7 clade bacterium TaxID=2029982 RepID=A0A5S9QDM7_9GAMM|nr:Heme A synthase [BD1-7 clade bacterium]